MGLFDNIFLDEDAVTAVAEKPTETKPEEADTTSEAKKSEVETTTTPEETPQVTSDSEVNTHESGTVEEKGIDSEVSSSDSPSLETGLSFDIGGDIDIGGDLNFGSETLDEAGATAITTLGTSEAPATEGESVSVIQEDTIPTAPVSFTVNGVAYNTAQTPETETPETGTSIAMIQGSTAASGINIIEEHTPEVLGESAPQEDNSLMNIIAEETPTTQTTTDLVVPELTPTTEEALGEAVSEPIIAITEIQDPILVSPQDEIKDGSILSFSTEEPTHTESTEIAAITSIEETLKEKNPSESPQSNELATILDGFIQELGEREKAISAIIMKRHNLARRRMEIEEDHKTRMLAINMEDEFLKNKADRERAEQDRLQGVIKNFQKQIAATE